MFNAHDDDVMLQMPDFIKNLFPVSILGNKLAVTKTLQQLLRVMISSGKGAVSKMQGALGELEHMMAMLNEISRASFMLVQMLVGDYCSPEFADAILFPYIHRWNMQRRISYEGEVCVGTMDITVLDAYASYSLLSTPLNNSSDSGGDFYVPTSLLKPHNMAATPFGCCGPLTLKRTAAAIEARGAAGAVEEEGDGADSAVVTSAQQDGGEARATASLLLPPDEEDAMFGEEGGVLEEEIPYEDDIPIDLLAARTPPPPKQH